MPQRPIHQADAPDFLSSDLTHNGQSIYSYPSNSWYLVPFPEEKGQPFNADNLATVNDFSFSKEDYFVAAREAAEERWLPFRRDISWRLHVFLWAAQQALKSDPGSQWVELGTGMGYMATAVCHLLDVASEAMRPSRFILFDQFSKDLPLGGEAPAGQSQEGLFFYSDDATEVSVHFSKWPFVEVIPGSLPEALDQRRWGRIGFVHVDLNDSGSEIACLERLAPHLIKGATILFDDSGNPGQQASLLAHRRWADQHGLPFLQLPTGQAIVQWA